MTNDNLPKPIDTKDELIKALKDVAELEHQFMCMYLYAAFSLKKNPDKTCNEAQLEAVRRWASKIYMIARQEMEHLSVVNSMLAAIGAPPHFSRQNIPNQHPLYRAKNQEKRYGHHPTDLDPCDFPFIFEPFALHSAKRYVCMESAKLDDLLVPEQKKAVEEWCFKPNGGECPCLPSNFSLPNNPKTPEREKFDVEVGTIQELYHQLKEKFIKAAEEEEKKGKSLFVGRYDQHQVEILSEYDIYIFPITDLTSALNGIDLIVKQGEGIDAPPGFDSHFQNFFGIAEEYEKLVKHSSNFNPALPVPSNPNHKEIEEKIQNKKLTKDVYELFNYSYVTLLYVLTGLYGLYRPASQETSYPHLSAALREIAFAPVMTMLIRSLGEVLVQLPLDNKPDEVAAPTFYIDTKDDGRLNLNSKSELEDKYTDIRVYLNRFEEILKLFDGIMQKKSELLQIFNDDVENDVEKTKALTKQLDYIHHNVYRITGNLRQIYQTGVYSKFKTES